MTRHKDETVLSDAELKEKLDRYHAFEDRIDSDLATALTVTAAVRHWGSLLWASACIG